jgi:hypothetical protein
MSSRRLDYANLDFSWFHLPDSAGAEIVPEMSHGCFLPHHFQSVTTVQFKGIIKYPIISY